MRLGVNPRPAARVKESLLRPCGAYGARGLAAGSWPLVVAVACLLGGAACSRSGDRFASPGATLQTYRSAVEKGDPAQIWSCYSQGYQSQVAGGFATWSEEWQRRPPAETEAEANRPVAVEKVINDRIAFILFEAAGTRPRQANPFFYFVREPEGWKITSHLDSTFHRELERAIERGEFKLPVP